MVIYFRGVHIFQKSGCQLKKIWVPENGDTKQVQNWGITNIRRRSTRFSRHGDLATGIYVPLIYLFVVLCPHNISMCSVLNSASQRDCFVRRLVFILEVECVHCAVRTESLSIVNVKCSLQGVNVVGNTLNWLPEVRALLYFTQNHKTSRQNCVGLEINLEYHPSSYQYFFRFVKWNFCASGLTADYSTRV